MIHSKHTVDPSLTWQYSRQDTLRTRLPKEPTQMRIEARIT